jgi:hypothetical protein
MLKLAVGKVIAKLKKVNYDGLQELQGFLHNFLSFLSKLR